VQSKKAGGSILALRCAASRGRASAVVARREAERRACAGGSATTLDNGLTSPQGIAVDDTCVYWTSRTDGTVTKLAK
jgi:hypothetical protein